MTKTKKIAGLLICCCIFLSLLTACGTNNTTNSSAGSQEQESLEDTYYYQNSAFQIWDKSIILSYCPYSSIHENWLQTELDIYNNFPNFVVPNSSIIDDNRQPRTGDMVTLQDVKDYLSSKYNGDGSLKTYLNCNDQKITDYVNWEKKNGGGGLYCKYDIYMQYVSEHPAYANIDFGKLTIPQDAALWYKLSNPDYTLDLDNPTANRPQDPVWGKYDSVSS